MFPNIGLFLQVQSMSNLREFSVSGKPSAAKGINGSVHSNRRVADIGIPLTAAGDDLLNLAAGRRFGTILADPLWQFQNRTGKIAPEHKRLARYGTMTLDEIITFQPGCQSDASVPLSHAL